MVNVYEYLDYRSFLRDLYQQKKDADAFFSYRYMGRKIDVDAGYLVKILQGKYHLATKKIQAVSKFCQFDEMESEYFENLVLFSKAKTEAQNKIYFEKLLSLRSVGVHQLDHSQYEYYQKWHHSAIRAVVQFFKFDGDFEKLAKKMTPNISTAEATHSIELLTQLKLIEKNEEGIYQVTSNHITAGKEYRPLAIRQFQRETIELAKESLSRHIPEIRDISTLTVGIDEEALEDIRDIIRECRRSIQKRVEEIESPDSVYQLNFQVFPLSLNREVT